MQTAPKNVIAADDFEEMQDLSRFLEHVTEPAALLGPDGQTIPLPVEAFRVLCDVVEFMKQGKAVTIAPIDQRLTTQQAADFLGISRPTFVKILEKGDIPFQRAAGGRHRRVLLRDVCDYQARISVERGRVLDELTAQAVSLGLYEETAQTYRGSLKQARAELEDTQ